MNDKKTAGLRGAGGLAAELIFQCDGRTFAILFKETDHAFGRCLGLLRASER